MDALRNFWIQRAPRERLVLSAATVVLVLVAIYLLLIEPAATGIPRLEKSLPVARTQAEQLDRLLAEVAGLRARPQVAVLAPADARAALEKSLEAAGLKASRSRRWPMATCRSRWPTCPMRRGRPGWPAPSANSAPRPAS